MQSIAYSENSSTSLNHHKQPHCTDLILSQKVSFIPRSFKQMKTEESEQWREATIHVSPNSLATRPSFAPALNVKSPSPVCTRPGTRVPSTLCAEGRQNGETRFPIHETRGGEECLSNLKRKKKKNRGSHIEAIKMSKLLVHAKLNVTTILTRSLCGKSHCKTCKPIHTEDSVCISYQIY